MHNIAFFKNKDPFKKQTTPPTEVRDAVSKRFREAFDDAAALDAAGIIVNKNTIPFDTESPFKTSGIRVGTASATTRGMKEPEMIKIGTWIADVLDNIADESVQARVKAEAAKLVAGFPVP